jgi:hypothetical protein
MSSRQQASAPNCVCPWWLAYTFDNPDKLGLEEKVDFILTFWMVHEVKNKKSFFSELHSNLAPGGKILTAEPKMHVSAEAFQKTLEIALSTGLRLCGQPAIRFSLTALFESI